jgi:hypothetical protein
VSWDVVLTQRDLHIGEKWKSKKIGVEGGDLVGNHNEGVPIESTRYCESSGREFLVQAINK